MRTSTVTTLVWIAAFILTVLLAVFQRMTGPSYPLRGSVTVPDGTRIDYRLPRTHGGAGGLDVELEIPETVAGAALTWRRYPTSEAWTELRMKRNRQGRAVATIPHQPPAGKVEYRIVVETGGGISPVPGDETVIARFRADVPAAVLIPHILAMFGSMLVASRALIESLRPSSPEPRRSVIVAMVLLGVGGLFLGPVVQKYAFGAYWTGWPLGHDLTDNKTLIAVLAWLPATVLAILGRRLRTAVVAGWIVMMGIFLIPHSLRGSEMDWSEGEIKTGVAAPGPRAPRSSECYADRA
jgi:hypothetical protein